jgi:hypothetical protein
MVDLALLEGASYSRGRLLDALAILLLLVFVSGSAAAQSNAADEVFNPRDFSGVWMNKALATEQVDEKGEMVVRRRNADDREPPLPPLTPDYLLIYHKLRAQIRGEGRDPSLGRLDANGAANCQWIGTPGIMAWPYPLEFVHTQQRIFILFEAELLRRQIWMDGRGHPDPEEIEYTFMGHSIGRWEGDVLVVETVGLREDVLFNGLPHSEQARIVERMRYSDPETLEYDYTINDPLALTEPITRRISYGAKPDWELMEYSCTDNNRHKTGADGLPAEGVVE